MTGGGIVPYIQGQFIMAIRTFHRVYKLVTDQGRNLDGSGIKKSAAGCI